MGSKRTRDDELIDTKNTNDVEMEEAGKKITKTQNFFSPQLLKLYYEYMFPFDLYVKWLSYYQGPTDALWNQREFSFTSEIDGSEIYTRYRSFETPQQFRKTLCSQVPHKIDIGAVFNKPPKNHRKLPPGVLKPVEREVIFDIDISDYDDVRTCCQDKQVCDKCWPLMTCAVKVLNKILKDDFGFDHLFWVFSGRRGIHCWVGDKHARKFETSARSAIISYASVKPDPGESKLGNHHLIRRSYEQCLPYFEQCSIVEQNILGSPLLPNEENEARIMKILKFIPYEEIRESLITKFSDPSQTSEDRWNIMKLEFEERIKQNKSKTSAVKALREIIMQIVLFHTYPRLDVEVTRHMNHLLKSPFCVHPKTGKLCIPIDPEDADSFSPNQVPTLRSLVDELNTAMKQQEGEKTKIDYRQIPSMKEEVGKWKKCLLDGLGNVKDNQSNDGMEW